MFQRSIFIFGLCAVLAGAFGLLTAPGPVSEGSVVADGAAASLWGGAAYCPQVKAISGCKSTISCGTCNEDTSYVSAQPYSGSCNFGPIGTCYVCGMLCGNYQTVTGCAVSIGPPQ
jgi:hypothetical protein